MTRPDLGRGAGRGALRPDRGAGARPEREAPAQPRSSGPRRRTRASTVTVMVTNSRKTDLVQLQAAESGSVELEEGAGPAESRQTGAG